MMTLPSSGIRLRDSSFAAGDEKTTNPSVVRCDSLRQLGLPFFNRRKTRSLHPAVLASGDTSTSRRQVLLRLRYGGSVITLVQGPSYNSTFFVGLICKTDA
jgi:hypothetical protein